MSSAEGETATPSGGAAPAPAATPAGPAAKKRFFGSKTITAEGYAGELAKLNAEVLTHLAQGATLSITLDVEATSEEGFTEQQIRTVSENARTLKFDPAEFE